MPDISIRITGQAGRITLMRPEALNAMTYEMCLEIEAALDAWRENDAVKLIIMDATGERAFCAGGDIADLYAQGSKGNYAYGQKFWADEYRLNAKIFTYPKPIVSFLQGFTMGGGVGLGCHGSHRIVGQTSQIAMPECGIGLVPDVGGSLMLALAPGRLGEYLGATGTRMNGADAIYAGFADHFIAQESWPALIETLESSAEISALEAAVQTPPAGILQNQQDQIDRLFAGDTLSDIRAALSAENSEFAQNTLKALSRNAPLSAACSIDIVHRLKRLDSTLSIYKALELEYRYTYRAQEFGDFQEGIRAQIIDKDRNPRWQYADGEVPLMEVAKMLLPLGADTLDLGEIT
jgi:enoyl-CoA hydratase